MGIHDCPAVSNLGPLAKLSTVGSLGLTNLSLTNLAGLEALSVVTGDLLLNELPVLTDLTNLGGLTAVGSVQISANPRLSRLGLFGRITRVPGLVDVDANPMLTDLTGLSTLVDVGTLEIFGDDGLVDLHGLENLVHVGGFGAFPYLDVE